MADNPPIRKYLNEIEYSFAFRIKKIYFFGTFNAWYDGITWINLKQKDGENVSYLDLSEVALVRCNIANNDCQQDSSVCINFFPINYLFSYYIFLPITLYF